MSIPVMPSSTPVSQPQPLYRKLTWWVLILPVKMFAAMVGEL